jgi:hypothetical protein
MFKFCKTSRHLAGTFALGVIGAVSMPAARAAAATVYLCYDRTAMTGGAFEVFAADGNPHGSALSARWPAAFGGENFDRDLAFVCTWGAGGHAIEDPAPLGRGYHLEWRCADPARSSRVALIWRLRSNQIGDDVLGREFVEMLDNDYKAVVSCRPSA